MVLMIHRRKLTLLASSIAALIILLYESVDYIESLNRHSDPTGWMHHMGLRALGWLTVVLAVGLATYYMAGRSSEQCRRVADRMRELCEGEGVQIPCKPVHSLSPVKQMNALLGILEAYSERHRHMVGELRKTNEYLTSIIKESPAAFYICDLKGQVQHVNPAFEKLYGCGLDQVRHSIDVLLPERLRGETELMVQMVLEGQAVSGYESVRRTADGKEIQVSLTIAPIRDEVGRVEALAVTSRNITERKETEERLRRSEKLLMVGQLAAGVAHEIRNPLTTLRGFVQLMKQRNAGRDAYFDLMLEELDRINLIVSEFIILAKPHLNHYAMRDINTILRDLARILEPQAHMLNVRFELRLEPDLPRIRCEEHQLKQVFLNIVKNGMEAMPGGGLLLLEARQTESGRIQVRIRDHGVGIPEEVLLRLGEPFVTSKEHGTGLGIMISQQILANHMGQMVIQSELDKGTCVDVYLHEDFEKREESSKKDASPLQQKGMLA